MFGPAVYLRIIGPTISVSLRNQVITVARMMWREKRGQANFTLDDGCGEMLTEFKTLRLADFVGTLFSFKLSHAGGETTAHILIRDAELDTGTAYEHWLTFK